MPSDSALPGMSSTPSISPMSQSWRVGDAGAKPTPQFPSTAVVTPCQHDGVRCGSQVAWPSKCVCMSTKPGVTSMPSASISRRPRVSTRPSSTIRPPSTATSAVRAGAPVPSTTVPPRITSSCMDVPSSLESVDLVAEPREHRADGNAPQRTPSGDGTPRVLEHQVVPHEQIADVPLVLVHVVGCVQLRPQLREHRLALGFGEPDDRVGLHRGDVEDALAGD